MSISKPPSYLGVSSTVPQKHSHEWGRFTYELVYCHAACLCQKSKRKQAKCPSHRERRGPYNERFSVTPHSLCRVLAHLSPAGPRQRCPRCATHEDAHCTCPFCDGSRSLTQGGGYVWFVVLPTLFMWV